jgi:hypothetical protein
MLVLHNQQPHLTFGTRISETVLAIISVSDFGGQGSVCPAATQPLIDNEHAAIKVNNKILDLGIVTPFDC